MKLSLLKPKGMSSSQVHSLVAGTLALLATLDEALIKAQSVPALHLPVWALTAMQVYGIVIPIFSRSMNAKNSGNGEGLIDTSGGAAVAATPTAAPVSQALIDPAPAYSTGLTDSAAPVIDEVVDQLVRRFPLVVRQRIKATVMQEASTLENETLQSLTQEMKRADLAPTPPLAETPAPPVVAEEPFVPPVVLKTGDGSLVVVGSPQGSQS